MDTRIFVSMKPDNRKNIKIAPKVHKELSVYVAMSDEDTICDFAGFAIMKELSARGHKFIYPKIKSSKK